MQAHMMNAASQGLPFVPVISRRKRGDQSVPLVCRFCSKEFTRTNALQAHENHHTGERPFKCEFCLKGFADKANFRRHVMIHTGEKPYKCEMCGKEYIRRNDLEMHRQTRHRDET